MPCNLIGSNGGWAASNAMQMVISGAADTAIAGGVEITLDVLICVNLLLFHLQDPTGRRVTSDGRHATIIKKVKSLRDLEQNEHEKQRSRNGRIQIVIGQAGLKQPALSVCHNH